MIKGAIQKEDTTIVNIYVPNIGTPQYIMQMLTALKREAFINTVRVETLTPHLQQLTDNPERKLIRKHESQ